MTDDENVRKAIEAAKNMSPGEWKRQLTEPSSRLDHEVEEEIIWQREQSTRQIFTSLRAMAEEFSHIDNEVERNSALEIMERVETYILLGEAVLQTDSVENAYVLGWELANAFRDAILVIDHGKSIFTGERHRKSLEEMRLERHDPDSIANERRGFRNDWILNQWRKVHDDPKRRKRMTGTEFRRHLIRVNRSLPSDERLLPDDPEKILGAKQIVNILKKENLWETSVRNFP